jgi:hypothetical protein
MPRLLCVCGSHPHADSQSPFGDVVAALHQLISPEHTATLDYEEVISLTEDAALTRLAASIVIVEMSTQHRGAGSVVRRIREKSPEARIICYFEGGQNREVANATREWGADLFLPISETVRHPHKVIAEAAKPHLLPAA